MSTENLGRPLFCATCQKQPNRLSARRSNRARVECATCGESVTRESLHSAQEAWDDIQRGVMSGTAFDCACGRPATTCRSHNGFNWVTRIYCEQCGIIVQQGDNQRLSLSTWNKIQSLLGSSK